MFILFYFYFYSCATGNFWQWIIRIFHSLLLTVLQSFTNVPCHLQTILLISFVVVSQSVALAALNYHNSNNYSNTKKWILDLLQSPPRLLPRICWWTRNYYSVGWKGKLHMVSLVYKFYPAKGLSGFFLCANSASCSGSALSDPISFRAIFYRANRVNQSHKIMSPLGI